MDRFTDYWELLERAAELGRPLCMQEVGMPCNIPGCRHGQTRRTPKERKLGPR